MPSRSSIAAAIRWSPADGAANGPERAVRPISTISATVKAKVPACTWGT
jgi:hypothetical protein